MTNRVLIVGGTGTIGTRIVQLLNGLYGTELLIAGSTLHRTQATADEMQERALRVRAVDLRELPQLRPDVVIDASGSFQGRALDLPRACIAAGSAYLDIADDRDFVAGIATLDDAARHAGVAVLSGGGMVPCLSMAAVMVAAEGLDEVTGVTIWATPGLQLMVGHASYDGIVKAAGKRFEWKRGGMWRTAHAWQEPRSVDFPELGRRVLSAWNTPELDLLPARWPAIEEATVLGGVELGLLQHGLSLLGWMRRAGLHRLVSTITPAVLAIARSSATLGGAETGLLVSVSGRRRQHGLERRWLLHARSSDGRFLPAAPAAALTRALLARMLPPGARVASLGLYDILAELRGRDVKVRMTEVDVVG